MNRPTRGGLGSRRYGMRTPNMDAPRLGRRPVRLLAAAVAASTMLIVAGCTSTGTEVPRTTAGGTASAEASEVTPDPTAYDGSDPSTSAGPTDEPAGAQQAGAAAEQPAAATTPVPQPGGAGDVAQELPVAAAVSNAPVALDTPGDFGGGVTVTLGSIESVDTRAELPGEVAGPGIRLQVTIANGSAEPVDLTNVVVDLTDAGGTPAIPMTSGAGPLSGSVAAGASASGVYVFATPATYTDPATISVGYSAAAPVVVFSGDAK